MRRLSLALLLVLTAPLPAAEPTTYLVGAARVEITPKYPVRLHGFGFRRTESEGVRQPLWAKALAIGSDADGPAVLITVDNLGIPEEMTQELARRLQKKAMLDPARLAITATHTHTAPMFTGVAPTIFGLPIPPEHQEHIDRYTRECTDKLEEVALAALKDRKPARLEWGIGKVTFAINRRTKGGPVDHELPLLVVRDAATNKIRALYVSYACHCVTLSDNKISGDWAGYAQEHLERAHPGAVALVSIGCGADANPSSGVTKDRADLAEKQGEEIAAEVRRLLQTPLRSVQGKLTAKLERIDLAFDKHPTRAEWEEKAKRMDATGHHARVQLARLDRGEALRTQISYPIQSWTFGDSLALVFLAGEVVVDYSLRLKHELDGRRLWINAYSNAAPCYVPSERVLKEGGYEGGGAMVYYDQPTRLKPGLEKQIVSAVHGQLDRNFHPAFDPARTRGSRPLAPEESLALIQTKKDLAVELVVAEPLVASPVAIDFGPDGRLWVCEMYDYPSGLDGKFKPGGRVRVLESTKGDGRFDKATVFLDNIPFPTGITVWRKGVLVCAAPDILYAEDTDGDGKADVVKKLYSGFGTDNYQARVNSLEYGLDGWIYGSCGLFGGTIHTFTGKTVALGDRDFRIKPDTGEIEPATGRTQQGRVRNDWGDWFGCDNSTLCVHYPLADHYLRRNPHVAPPPASVLVPEGPDPNHLYPASASLQLFMRSGPPGRTTAACGLGIYRDDLLGEQYHGNAFVCEPVNLMLHRMILSPRGSTFVGRRASDEKESEFLASTDNWFRPVQARTGPDGCLWVVDMYRYVIEHPRWIPPEDLARLDVRAGHDMGRIYRIRPKDRAPRPWQRLDKLDTAGLVAALDSPNSWQRDLATQTLLWKGDKAAVKPLQELVAKAKRPEGRLHALCALDGLKALPAATVRAALADEHPGVRRHAVRLAASTSVALADLDPPLLKRATDENAQVRLQLASVLGKWPDAAATKTLGELVRDNAADPYLLAAAFSSATRENVGALLRVVFFSEKRFPREGLANRLLVLAASLGDTETLPKVLAEMARPREGKYAPRQMTGLAAVLDVLDQQGQPLAKVANEEVREQMNRLLAHARRIASDEKASEEERRAALSLLGREPDKRAADVDVLASLLVPQNSAALQSAAVTVLGRIPDDRAAAALTAAWNGLTPDLRNQALDLLLGRDAWQRILLTAIAKKEVPAAQIDAARRGRLLAHKDEQARTLAAQLFAAVSADRRKILDDYKDVTSLSGDLGRGKAVFAKICAACHHLHGVGHAVGPDLAALNNKSPQYLLTEILDPNRNVDSRYVEYLAVTKAGRTFNGLLASESATSITLRGQEGKQQVLLRGELDELRSTGKSLMPEGLEKDLSKQDLADVIAYLAAGAEADVKAVARQLLNESLPSAKRQALLDQHSGEAAELVSALVEELRAGTPDEYRRIPWIWRVSIAAGKRDDDRQIRRLLHVTLPPPGEPLHDWQAVAVGGGIINGLSQSGRWPRQRLNEILQGDGGLAERLQKAITQAAAMADNEKVPPGTRYDALRLIALDGWDKRGPQLAKYLAKGINAELQMGAISGLSDVDSPRVAPLLVAGLDHFNAANRKLAVEALLRTDARITALLDAIEQGRIKPTVFTPEQTKALREVKNAALRERASKLLP
jgi:putative membrane-bound dehydrogenase-like protein